MKTRPNQIMDIFRDSFVGPNASLESVVDCIQLIHTFNLTSAVKPALTEAGGLGDAGHIELSGVCVTQDSLRVEPVVQLVIQLEILVRNRSHLNRQSVNRLLIN